MPCIFNRTRNHSCARKAGGRLLAFLLALALGAASAAGDYPDKPIRLIVPFAPGGVTDTSARLVAERLGQRLGQQLLVDNRPGAAGNIGMQLAASAAPDGYTLVVGFDGTMVINPHVYASLPFDPVKDFAPISKIGDAALVIVTHPSVPVKTFRELVAYSRSQAGGVSYGSAGTGSTPHLAGELLKIRTGAHFVHIPYKGGGQALADVVGGTLPMLYTAVAGAHPFIQKGQVNAIAVSGKQRLPSLPQVPTLAEAGVTGFEAHSWIGLLAPAKTPPAIVQKLQRELHAVVNAPETREQLAALGISACGNSPAEFGRQILQDLHRYATIVQQAHIRIE